MHMGTSYQFAHYDIVDGERCLIWGNGIGEVLIPVSSPEYLEALNDRAWALNALTNEGEIELLETYFRSRAKLSVLYGRLYGAGTFVETSSLPLTAGTTVGAVEVVGAGYTPVAWNVGDVDFSAPVDVAGSHTTTSTVKTFSAAGAWTAAVTLVLATTANNTGKLLAWVALTENRTLVNQQTLDVAIKVGLT